MGSFLFGRATFQLISGWSYPRDNPRSCGIHDFLACGVRLLLRQQEDGKIPGIYFQLCLHGSPQVVDPVDGTRGEGDYGTPGIHSCRSRTDEKLGFQTPFSNSPIPCWELPDPIPSSQRVEFQCSSACGPARHFHFLGTAHPSGNPSGAKHPLHPKAPNPKNRAGFNPSLNDPHGIFPSAPLRLFFPQEHPTPRASPTSGSDARGAEPWDIIPARRFGVSPSLTPFFPFL